MLYHLKGYQKSKRSHEVASRFRFTISDARLKFYRHTINFYTTMIMMTFALSAQILPVNIEERAV